MKMLYLAFLTLCCCGQGLAQSQKTILLKAATAEAQIQDGPGEPIGWHLDPQARPDVYYVNNPRLKSKITLKTDIASVSLNTRFGEHYDLMVLLGNKDTCHIRIAAVDDPGRVHLAGKGPIADTIPFTRSGSRIYLQGKLNNHSRLVNIQFDLGAGTQTVNKTVAAELGLTFDGKTTVSNTEGLNDMRSSAHNRLSLGKLNWSDVPFVEVGNMKANEDLIIGNGLFRDKVIEVDYDRQVFIISGQLPAKVSGYQKQPVYFEQNRPKFQATIAHEGQVFTHWFLFDTGRDGTMLIGEDFTAKQDNWNKLKALQLINGRKIVRLDATIAGSVIKDIVTNAADPQRPAGRPTLFGNQVLSRFNFILDNRTSTLYLKPNGRTAVPYSDFESYTQSLKK